MAEEKRVIQHVGRDYFEKIDGHATVITGGSDNAQQTVNARQLADTITPDSPKADVARLLALVREEVTKLDVSAEVKAEAVAEVQAAEVQIKKAEPDKPKIADRLTGAVAALKGMTEVGAQAVAVGNMLGKAILWCGEQWTPWVL